MKNIGMDEASRSRIKEIFARFAITKAFRHTACGLIYCLVRFLTKLRKHFYIVSGVFHRQCSGTEIKLLV